MEDEKQTSGGEDRRDESKSSDIKVNWEEKFNSVDSLYRKQQGRLQELVEGNRELESKLMAAQEKVAELTVQFDTEKGSWQKQLEEREAKLNETSGEIDDLRGTLTQKEMELAKLNLITTKYPELQALYAEDPGLLPTPQENTVEAYDALYAKMAKTIGARVVNAAKDMSSGKAPETPPTSPTGTGENSAGMMTKAQIAQELLNMTSSGRQYDEKKYNELYSQMINMEE